MTKYWDEYSKKELLELPQRDWETESCYDSVSFVNTKMKHDSGYNQFAIIGCNKGEPVEIAGYMDDFRLDPFQVNIQYPSIAVDCSMKGVFRLHSESHKIKVGSNTSTTMFGFIKNEK